MATNSIVHFIGFVTPLDAETFIPAWESYAKKAMNRKKAPVLLQLENGSRHKFSYMSLHTWPETEAHFSFTKADKAGHFHEMQVQLVHIGGYLPMEQTNVNLQKEMDCRLLVMSSHNENDPDFYSTLPNKFRLNRYQAYYESCTYGYIFEYFATETELEEIMQTLKQRAGTERHLYRDCLAAQT